MRKHIAKLTFLIFSNTFIIVPICSMFAWSQAYSETKKKETLAMKIQVLGQRGKQLRMAIDLAFKELSDARMLKPMGTSDITEVVIRHIPVGTSFDEAEYILRGAGFSVDRRPGLNTAGNRPNRFDVVASIVPFVQQALSRVNVYVSLTPKAPGDYSTVSRISAGFVLSTL